MGAYLSEPVTEKLSSDEGKGSVRCGASCMQGWRINQEDAHNTILDFDTDTMMFAVYDGHGGAEVASYCSQKLPDYIKNMEAYKNGDLTKALEEAFLGFDALIATEEVMDELKKIAGQLNPPPDDNGDSSDDEENMSTLYQDAQLPLREVLAKYTGEGLNCAAALRAKLGEGGVPLSPCLRGKKDKEPKFGEGASSSSSGAGSSSSGVGCSADEAAGAGGSGKDDAVTSSTNTANNDQQLNGEVTTTGAIVKEPTPDSSVDKREEPQPSADEAAVTCNGDAGGKGEDDTITSSHNGDKEKGSDKAKVSSTGEEPPRRKKIIPRRAAADMFKSLLNACADDDDSDSNDETFEGDGNSSSGENVNGAVESSEEGEESDKEGEGEGEGEEDEESSDEEYAGGCGLEEPGSDSGCTAVVALLRGKELYVANAGDSRCIVCREGVAVDMSLDHKPEDAPELERITNAGGKVSQDGRINGGLNLSRAIGDHSYKQNKELDAKLQMITALPDVKTLTIDPERDEFMVLACDGIWNYMSSQDVCDFISARLKEGRERLSQICEEMFDHCLAPSTAGDGTGCDNMTAVLVTFGPSGPQVATATADSSKRPAETDPAPDTKRHKPDSSSLVTSSV